jgi:maltose/moltooligosaccharide transporter
VIGGPIVKHIYNNHAIYALVMAGMFMFMGAIAVLFVNDGRKIQIIDKP